MAHSGFFSRTERKKRYYLRQKQKGLCRYCSKKAVKNLTLCEYHRQIRNLKNKKYRLLRKVTKEIIFNELKGGIREHEGNKFNRHTNR